MALVRCIRCQSAISNVQLKFTGGMAMCGSCESWSYVLPFPAVLEDAFAKPPPPPSDPPAEGEAACFYSPNRKASKECAHCGVLISEVWAAQWGTQTVCLKCLEHQRDKAKGINYQTGVTRWDGVAFVLALYPVLVLPTVVVPRLLGMLLSLVFVTAPLAVVIALWHWNSPRGLVPTGRWRLAIAIVVGLVQVTVVVWGVSNLFAAMTR